MRLQEVLRQLELAQALVTRVRVILRGTGDWLASNGKQPLITAAVDTALALLAVTIDARRQDIRRTIERGGTVHDLQL